MNELLINIIGTIIGGLVLTLILFFLNEFIFPKKNLTGEWKTTAQINKSSFKPYINMIIEYKIHLIQKGNEISGSGEKTKETLPDGTETEYLREKRVLLDVEGYFERRYFRKSRIYLNINEKGINRETRSTYFLNLNKHNVLDGTFISTAADASGIIIMKNS